MKRTYLLLFAPASALLTLELDAQQARLTHDAPQVMFGADHPPLQRLFDYDADGDLDAVGGRVGDIGGSPAGFETAVWFNDGQGVYRPAMRASSNVVPPGTFADHMPIAVGDLNGDGRDDFVQAAGEEIWQWLAPGPGQQGFDWSYLFLTPYDYSRDVAIADFDGDGTDDLAVLTDGGFRVYWSGGAMTVQAYDVSGAGLQRLLVADTDGDAPPDLLLVGGWSMVPLAFQGRSFAAGTRLDFAAYGPKVDAGDIDRDGDADLVAFHMPAAGPATVEVFRRIGAGAWSVEPPYEGGPAEYLADVDGDGDPDGVCCGGGGGGPNFDRLTFASTFEISSNQDGRFAPSIQIPGLGSRSLAGAADVDGDGDVDLVAGRCVYFQQNGWTGSSRPELASIESERELADFDGDGDVDPWRQSTLNPNVERRAYRNLGDGSYAWQDLVMETLAPGQSAGGPRLLGDFDDDGDPDVILAVWSGASFLHQGLWRNSGGGSFHYAGACAPTGVQFFIDTVVTAENFLVGDLQGDGDTDLIVTGTQFDQTKVYCNDGHGFFTLCGDYPFESFHALADFDGDGLLDALTNGGGPLSLRLGQAAGAAPFGAPQLSFGNFYPTGGDRLDVGDFNQDGDPDVAAVEYQYPGTGDFRYQPRLLLNSISLGQGLAFLETSPTADASDRDYASLIGSDVNLDGRMDLVFGPFQSERSFRVYLQKAGAGRWLGPDAFEAGVEMVLPGILRDDVDGDGDPDLVGEYVSRNLLFHGAAASVRRQYGSGTPGTGGVVPTLGAAGALRGNGDPELRVTGLSAPLAHLAVSAASAFLPNVRGTRATLLVDPSAAGTRVVLAVNGAAAGVGEGRITVPIPKAASLVDVGGYWQALVPDAGAVGGLAASNGLYLRLAP